MTPATALLTIAGVGGPRAAVWPDWADIPVGNGGAARREVAGPIDGTNYKARVRAGAAPVRDLADNDAANLMNRMVANDTS